MRRTASVLAMLVLLGGCVLAAGCTGSPPDAKMAASGAPLSQEEIDEALLNVSGTWIPSDLVGCWVCPAGYPGWDGGTSARPMIMVLGADGSFAGEGMGYNMFGVGDSVRGIWRADLEEFWWYVEGAWWGDIYTLEGNTLSTSVFMAGPVLELKKLELPGLSMNDGSAERQSNSGTPAIDDITPLGIDEALVGVWYGETNGVGETFSFDADGLMSDQGGWDTGKDELGAILIVFGSAEPVCYRYVVQGDVLTMPSPSAGDPEGPVVTYRRVGLGGDRRFLGDWSYAFEDDEGSCSGHLGFEADGTVWVGSSFISVDSPGAEEGDTVEGSWRTQGSELWLYLGGEWNQAPYTIKGNTLTIDTYGDGNFTTYKRGG